jgi:hypothetical protein
MDNYDPAMAGRVWERVRHRQEDDLSPTLMKLFAEAAADAALCGRLAAVFSGGKAAVLRRVAEKTRGNADTMGGILRLWGTSAAPSPGRPMPVEAALRQCVGHALERAATLALWQGHGEYGSVLAALGETETENARLLLQVLGMA